MREGRGLLIVQADSGKVLSVGILKKEYRTARWYEENKFYTVVENKEGYQRETSREQPCPK